MPPPIMDAVAGALLALLRAGPDEAEPWPALQDDGWDALVRAAVAHGVAPIAYAKLARAPRGTVPDRALQQLKAQHLRTGLVNLRLHARLAGVLRLLGEHGIDVVVLKGAYLAQTVYGDASLRPMGDADILVRRGDLEHCAALLRGCGWRDDGGAGASRPVPQQHQLPGFRYDGVCVEVHWAIEDDGVPFAIDEDGLWRRAVKARIGAASALALCAEDLLLHVCLHTAYGHGWLQFDGGLRPLCDIAFTVRHFEGRFDWDALAARACAWRVQRCASLALALARDLVGARVPPVVLERLAHAQPAPGLRDAAIELTFGHHYADLQRHLPVLGRSWLSKRWRHLPSSTRWRVHLWPAAATLAHAYPSLDGAAASPLRYLAHWRDLAADGVRLSFGRRGRALAARERRRQALLHWLESSPPAPT